MIKWVVPSMASVVQEAIGKIRKLTDEARRIAKWYEEYSGKIYLVSELEHLRGQEWISMQELADILGLIGKDSAKAWCKTNLIAIIKNEGREFIRFADVEKAVVGMLPRDFPLLDKENGHKYSEALFVLRVNELHAQRGTYNCMIEPISINQINTGLGGRAEHGFASIFSRFGFMEPDGSPINIRSC